MTRRGDVARAAKQSRHTPGLGGVRVKVSVAGEAGGDGGRRGDGGGSGLRAADGYVYAWGVVGQGLAFGGGEAGGGEEGVFR